MSSLNCLFYVLLVPRSCTLWHLFVGMQVQIVQAALAARFSQDSRNGSTPARVCNLSQAF